MNFLNHAFQTQRTHTTHTCSASKLAERHLDDFYFQAFNCNHYMRTVFLQLTFARLPLLLTLRSRSLVLSAWKAVYLSRALAKTVLPSPKSYLNRPNLSNVGKSSFQVTRFQKKLVLRMKRTELLAVRKSLFRRFPLKNEQASTSKINLNS